MLDLSNGLAANRNYGCLCNVTSGEDQQFKEYFDAMSQLWLDGSGQ
jgi:hypothetical protein